MSALAKYGKVLVLLRPRDYERFVRTSEPLYKKQYGSLIVSEQALSLGLENVQFAGHGNAVCLDWEFETKKGETK